MNHHVHSGQQAANDGKRQHPAAHRGKTVNSCPSNAYVSEQDSAHAHGGFGGKAWEERAKHGNEPSIVVEGLPEKEETKTVAHEVPDVRMAERVDEMAQERAVPYIPRLRNYEVHENNKQYYDIILAVHTLPPR